MKITFILLLLVIFLINSIKSNTSNIRYLFSNNEYVNAENKNQTLLFSKQEKNKKYGIKTYKNIHNQNDNYQYENNLNFINKSKGKKFPFLHSYYSKTQYQDQDQSHYQYQDLSKVFL